MALLVEYAQPVDAAALANCAKKLAELLAEPGGLPWTEIQEVPADRLRQVPPGPALVLGMGGSALGGRALLAMAEACGLVKHEVRVLDTTDPDTVRPVLDWAVSRDATVLVISKSGTTMEVICLLEACIARGLRRFAFVSDPLEGAGDMPIFKQLQKSGHSFVHIDMPAAVGGRYSILTAVGQLPLHAAGVDASELLSGARAYVEDLRRDPKAAACVEEVAFHCAHPTSMLLLWCYADVLLPWGAWLQQLVCESLGRTREDGARVGEFVSVLRGPADQHSVAQLLLDGPLDKRVIVAAVEGAPPDSAFGNLALLQAAACHATYDTLALPRSILRIQRNLADLGALFMHGMFVTVLWANMLGVSPYGQPAVESIKKQIRKVLGAS